MNTRSKLIAVAVLLLVAAGCVKNPAIPKDQQAILNVNKAVASLADLNKSATQTVIALNAAKLISDADTSEVLKYTLFIAQSVNFCENTLQSTAAWPDKAAGVLVQMRTLALPPTVARYINNPNAPPLVLAFSAVVNSIVVTISIVTAGVS
jgi:hypothetical protein